MQAKCGAAYQVAVRTIILGMEQTKKPPPRVADTIFMELVLMDKIRHRSRERIRKGGDAAVGG
jgi:hypothetical protein